MPIDSCLHSIMDKSLDNYLQVVRDAITRSLQVPIEYLEPPTYAFHPRDYAAIVSEYMRNMPRFNSSEILSGADFDGDTLNINFSLRPSVPLEYVNVRLEV